MTATADAPGVDLEWDDDEVLYADFSPASLFVYHGMTQATLDQIDPRPGKRVLDVACGRGFDALSVARAGAQTVALEPSTHMLRAARAIFRDQGNRVQLVRGTAERLPFKPGAFDVAYCKGALDHFLDPAGALAEMARVTRPQGRVVIAIANFGSLACRFGRGLDWLWRMAALPRPGRSAWEIPEDHTIALNDRVLRQLMAPAVKLDRRDGVSLFWLIPGWTGLSGRLPAPLVRGILHVLGQMARCVPAVSDILVMRGTPRPESKRPAE